MTDTATVSRKEPAPVAGFDLRALCETIYPINRSISGEGVRRTLAEMGRHVPIEITELPTGTPIFDWTVPKEWNVREAWLAGPDGRRVVDIADHSLHLLGYSTPVRERMSLAALRPHLFSLPDHPDWIPYRTSYYRENWGFCLTHRQLESLPEGDYEVCIDTTLADGTMTIGEVVIPGDSDETVLITTHTCHPSLANDNVAGLAVATALAAELSARKSRHFTYRFVFAPGTIGAIAWIATHREQLGRIKHGLVLACMGDGGHIHYKRSRHDSAHIDRVVSHVLGRRGTRHEILPFSPYGYDERQYGSPGINLPVGCLMRTPYGKYPEYHSSADDLSFLSDAGMADSLETLREIVDTIEIDARYRNLNPDCEPRLGDRGLYNTIGGSNETKDIQMCHLWVLNYSDGHHSLLDIAQKSGMSLQALHGSAMALQAAGLLEPVSAR